MFPVGLVGRRALRSEVGLELLPLQVRVVVADLVVVPDEQPRNVRMDRLQIRVALVRGVAGAVFFRATP